MSRRSFRSRTAARCSTLAPSSNPGTSSILSSHEPAEIVADSSLAVRELPHKKGLTPPVVNQRPKDGHLHLTHAAPKNCLWARAADGSEKMACGALLPLARGVAGSNVR